MSKCFQNSVFFWPRPLMPPYYTHKKNQSAMAGPQMYEVSSVSSTKGCSKQIHDLLTGGARLFLRWVRLNSVSFLILSGWHGYFGTFPKGIGYFHCFLALYSSACKKICETSPWLVAFERTCPYQFSLWETLKKISFTQASWISRF